MLEYLNLKLDGLGVGESSLNIWMKNGRLKYSYDSAEYESGPSLVLNVSKEKADSFLEKLENLHLYRWKEQYFQEKKCDRGIDTSLSSRWYLLYKEVNKKAKEFQGLNDFPKDWEHFMGAITKLTEEMDDSRFNSISEFTMEMVDYRQQIHWNPVTREENYAEVEYRELISLSKKDKILTYQHYTNDMYTVKHEYNITNIADYLLGNIERYFSNFEDEYQPYEDDNAARISICLSFQNGTKKVLRRSYDRYGLPDDWEDFLEDFHKTLGYYGVYGAIFDSGLYHHGVKEGEYIYLSCIFQPNGKTYYFRSKEDNLVVGDFVLVPSGMQENAETVVMISEVLYCKEEEVPYPLEKTKFILRKLDDSDFFSFLSQDNPDEGI